MTTPPPRLSWSASRAALILLDAILLVASLCLWASRAGRFEHDGTLKGHPELQAQLRQTIDPNTASAASLCRLPGIGPTRAQQIILYRQHQAPAQQKRPEWPGHTSLQITPCRNIRSRQCSRLINCTRDRSRQHVSRQRTESRHQESPRHILRRLELGR